MAAPSCTPPARAGPTSSGYRASDSASAALAGTDGAPRSLLSRRTGAASGFSRDRELKRVALSGGTAQARRKAARVAAGPGARRVILSATESSRRHLSRLRRTAAPSPVTWPTRPTARRPPTGGPSFCRTASAFSTRPERRRSGDEAQIVVSSGSTPEIPCPHSRRMQPRYASGHLALRARGAVPVRPAFDLERLAADGQPVETARDVFIGRAAPSSGFTASDGLLVYVRSGSIQSRRLLRASTGAESADPEHRREAFGDPDISPRRHPDRGHVRCRHLDLRRAEANVHAADSGPRDQASRSGRRTASASYFASEKNGP